MSEDPLHSKSAKDRVLNLSAFSRRNSSSPARFLDPVFIEQARAGDAQMEMGSALIFGLEARNKQHGFVEHCARVGVLVTKLADAFSLDEAERADLHAAAQMHEIGMISVPSDMIESPARLDAPSLARLRAQAYVGAEILRPTQSPRTCRLVERQYCNFDEIRDADEASRDILIAGLFRAADVLDTMLHPRPYQANLDPTLATAILRGGEGTSFHPQAVESLLRLRMLS